MALLKKRKGSLDVLSSLIAIVSSIVSAIFAVKLDTIISFFLLNPVLTSLIISPMGMLLFGFRSRYRATYGLIEVIFGVFNVWRILSSVDTSTATISTAHIDYATSLPVIGSLYIIVRGLDNICTNIPDKEGILPTWLINRLYWLKNEEPQNNDGESNKKSHGI